MDIPPGIWHNGRMMTMKWYAHGSYSTECENEDELKRVVPHLSEKARKKLAINLRNFFYEVAFDLEVNEMTGKIMKVTLSSEL